MLFHTKVLFCSPIIVEGHFVVEKTPAFVTALRVCVCACVCYPKGVISPLISCAPSSPECRGQ